MNESDNLLSQKVHPSESLMSRASLEIVLLKLHSEMAR